MCLEDWRGHYRISFGVSTIITQFGLPFLCSLLVYVKILHTLRDRTRTRLASSVHLTRRREQRRRNRSYTISYTEGRNKTRGILQFGGK